MTANEQPMYATPVAIAIPDGERNTRHVKEIAFIDSTGNPIDITAGNAPAAGTITPQALTGYETNHNAIVRVSDDGSAFDFIMPSSIGTNLLTANTTEVARNTVGVSTDQITTEARNAIKTKPQIAAVASLATNAELAVAVQKINEIIAALKA